MGLTPAYVEIDFKPEDKLIIEYEILSDWGYGFVMYAVGDFAEYVHFDENETKIQTLKNEK